VKSMLKLAQAQRVSAFAHITGGGLTDNIPRVLPEGLEAHLTRKNWHSDPLFEWLAGTGDIAPAEMYRTFNCGIGMVVVVPATEADAALALLRANGETATLIGEIRPGSAGVVID
jgi:phosphoribosylformylglycinamidine cyclo-ligase